MRKSILAIGLCLIILATVFSSGCLESESKPKTGTATVKVIYSGSWSGACGSEGSMKSISGTGTKTFEVTGSIISANAQKQDDSSNTLTIQIIVDGKVVAQESTSAAYGIASVSYSFM